MREQEIRIIEAYENQINREIEQLEMPEKYKALRDSILRGRDEEEISTDVNISATEHSTFLHLWVNNSYRLRELKRAMGQLLLYSRIGSIDSYQTTTSSETADSSEHFWGSYGDFQIKSCSLFDSIGLFLAFSFFGIVDAPLYFHSVIDSIRLKYETNMDKERPRQVIEREPYTVDDKISWVVLKDGRRRYQKIKAWRNEIVHVFSPIMYHTFWEDEWDAQEKRQLLQRTTLNADIALKECKETYFIASLAGIAADELATSYIDTRSYHRDFYYEP